MAVEFVAVIAPSQNTPDLRRREVFRDARAISGIADVAALTEVREREDHRDMQRGFGDKYVVKPGHPVSTPVALRKRKWVVESVEVLVLHRGDKDIPTPSRYAVRIKARPRFKPWFKPVVFWHFHLVNGAFNYRHRETRAERRALWFHSINYLVPEISADIGKGYHLVITADPNTPNTLRFSPNQKVIFDGDTTMMTVIAAPGWRFRTLNRWKRDQKGDHDAYYARLRLEKA